MNRGEGKGRGEREREMVEGRREFGGGTEAVALVKVQMLERGGVERIVEVAI